MRTLFSFLFVTGLLLAGISCLGPLSSLAWPHPLLLVLGGTVAGIFLSFSPSDVARAMGAHFGTETLSEKEALKSFHLFSRLAELATAMGALSLIIGLGQMLQEMEDPTKIGPTMAAALSGLVYGVLLGEVVFRAAAADCLSRSSKSQTAQM